MPLLNTPGQLVQNQKTHKRQEVLTNLQSTLEMPSHGHFLLLYFCDFCWGKPELSSSKSGKNRFTQELLQ